MKHFHAFKANISVQWHMTKAFTGTISDFDPLSPRRTYCGSEALHKKGQIRLFFLRRLGIFRSGVSSWKLQSQTCLSSLPVCQKESYFSIFKLQPLSLFIIPRPPDAGRPVELPPFPSALAVPRFPGNDRRCCCGDGWLCVEWQSWEVLGDTTCRRNKVRT